MAGQEPQTKLQPLKMPNGKPQEKVVPHRPRRSFAIRLYHWLCIRHLFISGLLLGFTFLSAWAIWQVEKAAEEQQVLDYHEQIEAYLDDVVHEIQGETLKNKNLLTDPVVMEELLKSLYVKMEKKENIYVGSTLHKAEKPEDNMMWRFWPSVFYASNIYMTVGYGAIHCFTSWGQFFSIVYGFITIPFSLVVIRDLSQWILVILTRIYGRAVIRWRKDHGIETDPNEEFAFPIKFTVVLWFGSWFSVAFLTYCYDAIWALKWGGPGADSQDYFGAVWYSWITITSIGMSDDMPLNATTSPLLSLWYFLSLPMYKISLRIIYIMMENGILGSLAVLERKLEGAQAIEDASMENARPIQSHRASRMSRAQTVEEAEQEQEERDRIDKDVNNFTVGSIGGFMRSQADAYAGDFGRVRVSRDSHE
ncbi:unnamed protein product, partial [Mesorhabditis spiculigera]